MKNKYNNFVKTLQKLADVEFTIGVMSWDKEVNLPKQGANFRSQQIATLSGIAHEIFTDEKFGQELQELAAASTQLDEKAAKNVANTLHDYQRVKKFNKEFVIKRSHAVSKGYHSWLKAREANDFDVLKPALADLIDIKKEEAEILGYEKHPYDALMEYYEPGCRVAQLDILFKDVRHQLVDFVAKIRAQPQVDASFLSKKYDKDKQWQFGLDILKNIGYDFTAGRQDISAHPFTVNFSPQDVRVTTRIDEHNFGSMTWSCIHEGGHALYEQGLPTEQYGLPLGKYISLGIHESQSRLWENNVGRSLPYWKAHYAKAQATFPENLSGVSLPQFYKGINQINPSLVRVESDELHYHFHILIRYEIEKGLIEGSLSVNDLREIWNDKYKTYLNVDVPDDNNGVLQDIHWAHGSIGYFPTYSLGSFYAAQFFEQALKDMPNLLEQIEKGDNSQLLQWLRSNIHQHGRFYTAEELCKVVTGEPLNFKYFMDYTKKKYSGIYNF